MEGAVEAHAVIEGVHVVEDRQASLGTGGAALPRKPFGFERGPEAFYVGVVVAIGLATHALMDLFLTQQLSVAGAGVLVALIAMVDESLSLLGLCAESLSQRGKAERGVESAVKRHAQDAATGLIHNASQVKPAFLGGDKGNIGYPDLPRDRRSLAPQQEIGRGGAIGALAGLRPEDSALDATQLTGPH